MPTKHNSISEKNLTHCLATQFTRPHSPVFALQRMNLKMVLAEINTDSDKFIHGRSSSFVALQRPPLAL